MALAATLLLLAAPQLSATPDGAPQLPDGAWRAWLDCPGGPLPFGLVLEGAPPESRAWIVNGAERIEIPEVRWDEADGELVFALPHYDSEIRARTGPEGSRLDGTWRKRRGAERWSELPFHAAHGEQHRFRPRPQPPGAGPPPSAFAGRWAVDFEHADDPAVAILRTRPNGEAQGTVLTTLGDYRYLAGRVDGPSLRLSTFDGAHAFLFHATLRGDALVGDFWSSDSWHETWTARRDPDATLPDPWQEVAVRDPEALGALEFPDLKGEPRRLDDPALTGSARVITLFGSWCPNCNDEARLWSALHARYRDRGFTVTGLAFELTGDFERDARQVRRFRDRHDLKYPLLLAGTADKEAAAQAFPVLSRVKSFPTALFLDHEGRIRKVHSGFAGPATGAAHERLRNEYVRLIEELLAEAEQDG